MLVITKVLAIMKPQLLTDFELIILFTHSYLLSGDDQPTCSTCGHPLTVHHILLDCIDLRDVRWRHFNESPWIQSLNLILTNGQEPWRADEGQQRQEAHCNGWILGRCHKFQQRCPFQMAICNPLPASNGLQNECPRMTLSGCSVSNSVFVPALLDSGGGLVGSTFKKNCMKSDKYRPILSVAKMFNRECSFWQY